MLGHEIAPVFVVAALVIVLLPFIFSMFLAWSRGKSVVMSLILTLVFSWIMVAALFLLPIEKENANVEVE